MVLPARILLHRVPGSDGARNVRPEQVDRLLHRRDVREAAAVDAVISLIMAYYIADGYDLVTKIPEDVQKAAAVGGLTELVGWAHINSICLFSKWPTGTAAWETGEVISVRTVASTRGFRWYAAPPCEANMSVHRSVHMCACMSATGDQYNSLG